MGYKSRSNYAIGQRVLEKDWDKWFAKDIQESLKEYNICDTCKSKFVSEYSNNGYRQCIVCRQLKG